MRATVHCAKKFQLRSKLVKSVQNKLRFCHLKVVFQSPYKLHTLFRFKGTLNKKFRCHLVYCYSCSSCNAIYYGKTQRHFFTRAAKHINISNLTSKHAKNMKESAVSHHLLQRNRGFDFGHFDVLASDANSFRLLINESLLIKREKPVLNRTVQSFSLKLFD